MTSMLAGRCKRPYKLTWAAIAPHVPEPGDAGRISLADPALRFCGGPRPSDDTGPGAGGGGDQRLEYDLIVSHLVEAGMLQREVPEKTLIINLIPSNQPRFRAGCGDSRRPTWATLRSGARLPSWRMR